MAKLYFHYAAMDASKSASLLMFNFNLRKNGFKTMLFTSSLDDRSGKDIIKSRIGLSAKATSVTPEEDLLKLFQGIHAKNKKVQFVLFDEVQFASEKQIDQLATIVDMYDVNVHAYGLRTDFSSHLFPASRRLMEVAETITEIKTMCGCGKKATVNARFIDGKVVRVGEQILTGDVEDLSTKSTKKKKKPRMCYKALCRKCWYSLDE